MKNFWTLFRVQLNVNVGFSALRYRFRKEKQKIPQTIGTFIALLVAIGMAVGFYIFLMLKMYAAGVSIHNPEIVLAAAILGLQVFLLVTGIFYVMGVFFYSRDLVALIPLPVKPWQVLLSKFGVVLSYEYMMALPILLPPMLIYGIGQGAGVLYWLKSLLIIAFTPALPLMVASLIAVGLMRLLNVGRRKDLLTMIGSIVALVLILSFNMLIQNFAQNADATSLQQMLANQAQLINTMSSAFPPAAWATFALTRGGLESALYLLLYAAVSAALLAVLFWLAGKTYYRTAIRSEEVGRRAKAGKAGMALRGTRVASPVRALFIKEFRLMLRTPAFAMQCLIGSLIMPIIIPLTLLQGKDSSVAIGQMLRNPDNSLASILGVAGFMLFSAIINVSASSAVSREGKAFWFSRMIPVTPQRQVLAKFLLALSVAVAGQLLSAVMLIAVMQFPVTECAVALLLGLLGAVFTTALSMLPDVLKPKLIWTNPYEAVKQNMNVITAMLACMVALGVLAGAVLLLAFSGIAAWAVIAIMAALLAVLSVVALNLLFAAAGRYNKIEA